MDEEKRYCQNCDTELQGEFCSSCGQRDKELHLPVKDLASELIEVIPAFDERLLRSVKPFLFTPGFLTLEYLSGKRKRYISPFKLYFTVSFLFFFLIALNDSETKYVTADKAGLSDSIRSAVKNDTIIALVNGKQSGVKFTFVDSSKSVKLFGKSYAAALRKMKENPQLVFDKVKEYRPKIIFLLLPVFALLLKLLYVRSDSLYIRHLVFSFYFHAFVFFILFLTDLFDIIVGENYDSYSALFFIAIPLNLYYGMKRVYGQSRWKTLVKVFLLTTSYGVVFFFAFLISMLILIKMLYL